MHTAATVQQYSREVNALIIVSHPDEQSFSHAVARKAADACRAAGMEVAFHSIYDEHFDPVLSGSELARQYSFEPLVQRYIEETRSTDHFIFVHPDWWSGPPALLKGWIDRVFRPGIAYDWVGEEFSEKSHVPLLTNRSATVFIPTDRGEDEPSAALPLFWTELCAYAGLDPLQVTVFPEVRRSSMRQRRTWLGEVSATVSRLVASADTQDTGSKP